MKDRQSEKKGKAGTIACVMKGQFVLIKSVLMSAAVETLEINETSLCRRFLALSLSISFFVSSAVSLTFYTSC